MLCRNGEIMARNESENRTMPDVDYVAVVPYSGQPHAIGVGEMKQIPVLGLSKDKNYYRLILPLIISL